MTKRGRQKDGFLEDYISRLPDDVLVDIVSRLTIKEAARTSVLSSRWKNLWTFTPFLNFDGRRKSSNPTRHENYKFISWVNQVLKLHRGSILNEFRVHFDMCDSYQSEITNWVYTAMAKRVQNLELNLCPMFYANLYTFPQECYANLKTGSGLAWVNSLRSLNLRHVKISEEILEFLILNCPLLDQLSIYKCPNLASIKVVGSSIQLKHLDVQCCYSLKEIKISAPSILSFKYCGHKIDLYIENAPQLVDASIRASRLPEPPYFIDQIRSYFPQLKTLDLDSCKEVLKEFSLHELPKLVHLQLRVTAPNWESLLCLTCVMKACPFMEKLVLQQLNDSGRKMGKTRHQLPKYSHDRLKLVVLHGYLGRQFDVELAFYLLENATMLEKLIVEPSKNLRKRALRNCMKMVEARVPEGVEFEVSSDRV